MQNSSAPECHKFFMQSLSQLYCAYYMALKNFKVFTAFNKHVGALSRKLLNTNT